MNSPARWRLPFRFGFRALLILTLGIGIGFALNLRSFQFGAGPFRQARRLSAQAYLVEPPDVLQVHASPEFAEKHPRIVGQHLVGPDGSLSLGSAGRVHVAGMTLDEVNAIVQKSLASYSGGASVTVDIYAYNSKSYYIVNQGATRDQVLRMPITGNDTVLDAVAQMGGVSTSSTTRMWISRPARNGTSNQVLPIDWHAISNKASTETNYHLLPGDRLVVSPAAGRAK